MQGRLIGAGAVMDAAKRAAAEAAAGLVEDGMRVGLGTGSTAKFLVDALGRRAPRIVCVATSEATASQARSLGLEVVELDAKPLDLAIDGADEIEDGTLRLIKGLGGALLHEKIVQQAARRFVVVGDVSKRVRVLGQHAPLPVEVVGFAHAATAARIGRLGGAPKLRDKFVTDSGNVIYDCSGFGPIRDPFTLQRDLRAIAGVVETGLFLTGVERAIIGMDDGSVEVLDGPFVAA